MYNIVSIKEKVQIFVELMANVTQYRKGIICWILSKYMTTSTSLFTLIFHLEYLIKGGRKLF